MKKTTSPASKEGEIYRAGIKMPARKSNNQQNPELINERNIKSMQTFGKQKVNWLALNLVAPRSKVLSVGCGPGREVKFLAERNCRVTAVELNRQMINESRKFEPNAEYLLVDCCDFIRKNNYDYITGIWNVINYIPQKRRRIFIKRCFENLKEDGMLILTFQHRYANLRIFIKWLLKDRWIPPGRFPPSEINKWFKDIPFKEVINYKIKQKTERYNLIIARK